MIVYVMRHGQTNYNVMGLCNDDPSRNVRLTEAGVAQAQRAADELKAVPIERILVSQLPRTRETAAWVNQYHHVPIEACAELNDIRSGFDGRPVAEYFAAIEHDRLHTSANGGESLFEHKVRVRAFIEGLRQRSEHAILIVAHEETLRVFLAYFHGLSDEEMMALGIANSQVFRFGW